MLFLDRRHDMAGRGGIEEGRSHMVPKPLQVHAKTSLSGKPSGYAVRFNGLLDLVGFRHPAPGGSAEVVAVVLYHVSRP